MDINIKEMQELLHKMQKCLNSVNSSVDNGKTHISTTIETMIEMQHGIFVCDYVTSSDIAAYFSIFDKHTFMQRQDSTSIGYIMRNITCAVKTRTSKPLATGNGVANLWCLRNHAEYDQLRQIDKYRVYAEQLDSYLSTLDDEIATQFRDSVLAVKRTTANKVLTFK